MKATNLPRGITEEQLARHERRAVARAVANSTPLPGPVADALTGQPPKVGDLQFREVMLDDFVVLRKIGNPLGDLLNMVLSGQIKDPAFTEQALREVAFLWTRPPKVSFDLLEAEGPQGYRDQAAALRLGLSVGEGIPALIGAIVANVQRAFSTMVAYQGAQERDGSGFTKHQTEGQGTASAGGSISLRP